MKQRAVSDTTKYYIRKSNKPSKRTSELFVFFYIYKMASLSFSPCHNSNHNKND